jgi:hypothetical protein
MKPVEIILRKEGGGMTENDRVNLIKMHCKHICKFHDEKKPHCTANIASTKYG